ncbi:MAG: cytochrome c [candidate division Zixibacteria bacterium]|nr:cytochrome c [candidate division Zixibacteria bacterium]
MRIKNRSFYLLFLLLFLGFTLVFSQVRESEKTGSEEKAKIPTAFEQRCSVCHSLERVRVELENMIKDMHDKAGIKLSEESMKEIEKSFTLMPSVEPHKEIFQEKCATCHSLDKVVIAHQTKDDAEMNKIINRMSKKKGSNISPEEIQKIQNSMKMLNEIYEEGIEAKPEKK